MSLHRRSLPSTYEDTYHRCDACTIELDDIALQIEDRGTLPRFGQILSDTLEFCEDCAGKVLIAVKRARAENNYPERKKS